jgi:hypothetical protein
MRNSILRLFQATASQVRKNKQLVKIVCLMLLRAQILQDGRKNKDKCNYLNQISIFL